MPCRRCSGGCGSEAVFDVRRGCQYFRRPLEWREYPAAPITNTRFRFTLSKQGASRLVTIHAVLEDRPGVLMALISSFYDAGANILTVNQNIPVMGAALVSISARVDTVKIPVDFLLDSLRKVDGVQTIENITGEQ